MLETKLKSFSKDVIRYFPFGVFINGILLVELISLVNKTFSRNGFLQYDASNCYSNWYNLLDSFTEIEVYGHLLYSQFVLQVLIVGLILFLSLVGVIFLTSKQVFSNTKNQTSFCQLSRSYLDQDSSQILL